MLASRAAFSRLVSRWVVHRWLGAALLLASVLGLGAYYETNDDGLMTLLVRGQGTNTPVADLQLYAHGFSRLWAWLYRHWPGLPWYGLTLYALLLLAFSLLLSILNRAAMPRLGTGWRIILLSVFYVIALLESALWFNMVRVPVLLAGAGLLLALQRAADSRPRRHFALGVGLGATLLAALLRPSAALLGLLAVIPVVTWLPTSSFVVDAHSSLRDDAPAVNKIQRSASWRVLCWFAGLVLMGGLALGLLSSTPEMRYRRQQDTLLAQLNDYDWRRTVPTTTADSLAISGVRRWWLVADSSVFSPALMQRATRLDVPYFLTQVLPDKLLAKSLQVARDYFPVLAILACLLWLQVRKIQGSEEAKRASLRRHGYVHWLVFVALVVGLAGVFKLPPRLASPLLALFLTSQLVFALQFTAAPSRLVHRWALAAGSALLLLYGAKTAHRVHILSREQQVRGAFLTQLQHLAGPRLVAAASYENALKSLSPFRNYGPQRVLLLSGWPTLDPAQPRFRQQLSGHRQGSWAVYQLAADSSVLWLMSPAFVPLYNRYLTRAVRLPAPGLYFQLRAANPLAVADTALPVLVQPVRDFTP